MSHTSESGPDADPVGRATVALGDPDAPGALAEAVLAQARAAVACERAILWFWSDPDHVLMPLAWHSDDGAAETGAALPVVRPGQGLAGQAFVLGAPARAGPGADEIPWPAAWAAADGVAPSACVPIGPPERPIGVLGVDRAADAAPFADAEIERLEAVTAPIGGSLAAMRTLVELRARAMEARALTRLMGRGAGVRSLDALLPMICDDAVRLLGADLAGVALVDPGQELTAWRGISGARTDSWRGVTYSPSSPIGRWLNSSRPTESVVHDGDGDGDGTGLPPEELPLAEAEGLQHVVSVPLGDDAGALVLGWRRRVRVSPRHVRLAATLGTYAGTLVTAAHTAERLDVLLDHAPVAFAAIDEDGVIQICRGLATEAVGLGPDAEGRAVQELYADEPEVLAQFARVMAGQVDRDVVRMRGRSFDARFMPAPTGGYVVVATDVTERLEAEERQLAQARLDPLTGLPNRSRLRAELARRIGAPGADGEVTLLQFDLQGFTDLNDTLGGTNGDRILRLVGERIASGAPEGSLTARLGLDEFGVVASAATAEEAMRIGHDLQRLIAQPLAIAGTELSVQTRCGVASSAGSASAERVERLADAALRQAKRSGRPLAIFDAALHDRRRTAVVLTADLRRALEHGGLELHFQPIIELATGRPVRAEALVRWTHRERGRIAPLELVGLAERSGAIGRLTSWVIETALAEAKGWRAAGQALGVAVNISAIDLQDAGLVDAVAERVERFGLDPGSVCVEITESAALQESGRVLATLEGLAESGVGVAIDDYGTGYSSLAYLRRLPATELKIDRTFTSAMGEHPDDAAIVRSTVDLAHRLGLNTVAEGVEDEATLTALSELGCDYAQGYAIARPLPPDALLRWLRAQVATG